MCRKLICLIYFVLVLCLVGTSAAQNIDPSLVGWWTFDDGSGTVAKDLFSESRPGARRLVTEAFCCLTGLRQLLNTF